MVREVGITQTRLITPNVRDVTPSNGGQVIAQSIGRFAEEVGGQIAVQAEKNYKLRIDAEMKGQIARIERENMGQPEKMQEALANYHDVLIESVPLPSMENQVSSAFGVQAAPSINRAFAAKRARIDSETAEQVLLNINTAQEGMLENAPDLFAGNDDVSTVAAQKIQKNMLDIQTALNVTKADGTPMFSASQRVSKALAARDAMFQTAANTWIQSQPNKMAAYRKWQQGEVTIAFPDEDGNVKDFNIRDTIPMSVRTKIDSDFMRAIKDEISIQNAVEARTERQFKKNSEALEAELMVKMQDGADVFEEVEALKNQLEPDTYVDLRRMSIEAEPINNNNVYGDLLRRAYAGEDVTAEAQVARFLDKRIDNSSYVEIVKVSRAETQGVEDPVSTGRKYVMESLGSLSELLGPAQSSAIAGAKRNYDEAITQFRQENNRLPTQAEAFELADQIVPRWQVLETQEVGAALPKPMFMDIQEKTKANRLTPARMEDIRAKTDKYFMDKHGGDMDAVLDDPEYLREAEYLDSFEAIVNKNSQVQK